MLYVSCCYLSLSMHMYAHTFAPPDADSKLQRVLIHSLVSKARALITLWVGGWA